MNITFCREMVGDGFLRIGWSRLSEWRWQNSSTKREINKICDEWTKFIEAEFRKKVEVELRRHCLFSEGKTSLCFSVSLSGVKLISFCGRADERRNGSGESDDENLVWMRFILSLKMSRNVLALWRGCILRLWKWVWRIWMKNCV